MQSFFFFNDGYIPALDVLGHRKKSCGLMEKLEYKGTLPKDGRAVGTLFRLKGLASAMVYVPFYFDRVDGGRVWAPCRLTTLVRPRPLAHASPSHPTKAASAAAKMGHTPGHP